MTKFWNVLSKLSDVIVVLLALSAIYSKTQPVVGI